MCYLVLNSKYDIFLTLIDVDKMKNIPFWCSEEYIHKKTVNTFWNKKQHFNDPINDTNNCLVDKDEICNNKCHTKGVLLTAYNCGIVCSYREIISSE